jgi:hypothetical protein
MGKEHDWRQTAREIYREAQADLLQRWSGPQEGDIAFFKEELEEAPLDLKQAFIEDNAEEAAKYSDEVLRNLTELRARSEDF